MFMVDANTEYNKMMAIYYSTPCSLTSHYETSGIESIFVINKTVTYGYET